MAAAAIMEAFINETTQGKQKENMEKNKSNLKKHLQNTNPPTTQSFILTDSSPLCFFVMKNVEIQLLVNLRWNTFDFYFKSALNKQVSS